VVQLHQPTMRRSGSRRPRSRIHANTSEGLISADSSTPSAANTAGMKTPETFAYDATADAWSSLTPLPKNLQSPLVELVGDTIVVMAGGGGA
jgi:hypothetical protein